MTTPLPEGVIVSVEEAGFFHENGNQILDGFNLSLRGSEITALVGPSGSGKTTLLRLIAGMDELQKGRVRIDLGEDQIPIAYMFQDYDTFGWMTVRDNLMLSGAKPGADVDLALAKLGLSDLLDRYPRQLSGGQRKRVALARSLLAHPALLIMDEPFGSLDIKSKLAIFELLEGAFADTSKTGLFVTHSVEEAIALADRILILAGPPLRIVASIAVDVPHPRQTEFLTSNRFRQLEADVLRKLLAS